MSGQFGTTPIGGMQYNGVTIGEAMMNGEIVYRSALPVVQITGTSGTTSRDQFRDALSARGLSHTTVEVLPFTLDTSQATHLGDLFISCRNLTEVPEMDTSKVTNMARMFRGCQSLTSIPNLDTSKVTNASFMFDDCQSLTSVPALDFSAVTNLTATFGLCGSLTSAPITGVKVDLTMAATVLTPAAANTLMQGLVSTTGQTLTLPSTANGANAGIAVGKGWNVTGISIYPLTGEWQGSLVNMTPLISHAVSQAGTYILEITSISGPVSNVVAFVAGSGATKIASESMPALAMARNLNAGEIVQFLASSSTTSTANIQWRIRKTTHPIAALDPDVWIPYENNVSDNYGSLPGNANTLYFPTPQLISAEGIGRHSGGVQRQVMNNSWSTGGTIGMWFKYRSTSSGGKTYLQRTTDTVPNRYELYLNVDPALGRAYAGGKVNNTWWDVSIPPATVNICDGNWHFIVASLNKYSSSRWALTLWVDNKSPVQVTKALSSSGAFSGHNLWIGGSPDGTRLNMDTGDVFSVPYEIPSATISSIYSAGPQNP